MSDIIATWQTASDKFNGMINYPSGQSTKCPTKQELINYGYDILTPIDPPTGETTTTTSSEARILLSVTNGYISNQLIPLKDIVLPKENLNITVDYDYNQTTYKCSLYLDIKNVITTIPSLSITSQISLKYGQLQREDPESGRPDWYQYKGTINKSFINNIDNKNKRFLLGIIDIPKVTAYAPVEYQANISSSYPYYNKKWWIFNPSSITVKIHNYEY